MDRYDSAGNPLSQCSAQARDGFSEACTLFHGYFADPVARIDAVLAEEPRFPMGLCLKAGILATSSERGAEPALRSLVGQLQACTPKYNARERGHLAALQAWLAGDFERATEAWGTVLFEFPRDLLALQLAHLGDFYLGHSRMLRDRPARVLQEWDSECPGYGFVLGMHAFGLEESGQYDDAEREGRRALDLDRRDPWAVHAVTHVMEMQGRTADGIAWLEQREADWAPENAFAFHNWWHLALYHLDEDDCETALRLHDDRIRPASSEVQLEMVDASALLWRLWIRNEDVGDRWDELARRWEATVDDGYYAFNDVHAMLALSASGRLEAAGRLLSTMRRACGECGTNAAMTREVGLPVATAVLAFSQGHYESALDTLLPVLPIAHRFGGSHAQRDLLALTALEAALRGHRNGAARALISERLASKPASRFNRELAVRAGMRLRLDG